MLPGSLRSRPKVPVLILGFLFVLLTVLEVGRAEERKFLVFVANMPRSFTDTDGIPPTDLPSFDRINDVYFRLDPENGLGSFAEYWEEVSYGIVRIDGKTLGIAELPWPQYPVVENTQTTAEDVAEGGTEGIETTFSPSTGSGSEDGTGGFFGLDQSGEFTFGVGERIREDRARYLIDQNNSAGAGEINGPQNGLIDAVPTVVTEDLDGDGHLDLGVEDIDEDGRFDMVNEDLNGNCELDSAVSLDDLFCPNANQDGNWTPDEDCDGNGNGNFVSEDTDNDGYLDVGENPDGCGSPRCNIDAPCANPCESPFDVGCQNCYNPPGLDTVSYCVFRCSSNDDCLAPEVCYDYGGQYKFCALDVNGDGFLSPTEDIDRDGNFDIINEDTEGDCLIDPNTGRTPPCEPAINQRQCCVNQIIVNPTSPDPVWTPGERFRDVDGDEYYDAFFEPAVNYDVDDDGFNNLYSQTNGTLDDPGDFIDTNVQGGDQKRDFPEPLEDFLVMRVTNEPGTAQYAPVSTEYIRNNYPGNVALLVRRIGNRKYDPPDDWDDVAATNPAETEDATDPRKLEQDDAFEPFEIGFNTPRPSWFEDFWRARYGESSPAPDWAPDSRVPPSGFGMTPRLIEFQPVEESTTETLELGFAPNTGGSGGWGTVFEQMLHLRPAHVAFGINCRGLDDIPEADVLPDPVGDGVPDDVEPPGMEPGDGIPDICLNTDFFPGVTPEDVAYGRVFDYNGSSHLYAYLEGDFEAPLTLGLENDYLFHVSNDGYRGCIGVEGAEPDGDWGCDFTRDGEDDTGSAPGNVPDTPLQPGFPPQPQPGSLLDLDDDDELDDWLFSSLAVWITDEQECPGLGCPIPGDYLPFLPTDTNGDGELDINLGCDCIDFNVDVVNGVPETNSTCRASNGRPVLEDDEPLDDDYDCYVPDCESWYYPIPKYKTPTVVPDPNDPIACRRFNRRFGDGTLVAQPADPPGATSNWGGADDPESDHNVLPPATLLYDGPKEYDDLASSIYHTRWTTNCQGDAPVIDSDGDGVLDIRICLRDYGGDQALGEVTTTSPDVGDRNNYGHDRAGLGSGGVSFEPDNIIEPAGPLAGGDTAFYMGTSPLLGFNGALDPIHGSPGFDGGNMLFLELLTRRTDGSSPTVPLHAPDPPPGPGCSDCPGGFRDFNLDGLIDLGEGRAFGTENYVIDSFNFTRNDGMRDDAYPFNRDRVMEDVIEVMDVIEDFDIWINTNVGPQSNPECSPKTGVDHIILLPQGLPSRTPFAVFSPGQRLVNTMDDILVENLPPGEPPLRVRLDDMAFATPFTNLASSLDRNGENDVGDEGEEADGSEVLVSFAAHEFGHYWECWPDLYDYDVFDDGIIERPIGRWDLMAGSGSGLVHVIPVFKQDSGWVMSSDLRTVLSPGVPKDIHLSPIQFVSDSYYHYENPQTSCRLDQDCGEGEACEITSGLCRKACPAGDGDCPAGQVCENDGKCSGSLGGSRVERFYFFHMQDEGEFSSNLPWNIAPQDSCEAGGGTIKDGGMMVLHTDIEANGEGRSVQQRLSGHFTYQYEQADGQHSLENASGNGGDGGDPFPGICNVIEWGANTDPDNTWWSSGVTQPRDSGMEILDVQLELSGSSVTFLWFPQDLPTLRFVQPPGGQSIGDRYLVKVRWSDINAGTGLTVFAQRDEGDLVIVEDGVCTEDCYAGDDVGNSLANPIRKDTPGNSSEDVSVALGSNGLEDGTYRFYAFLDPAFYSPGVDGLDEQAHTDPTFSDAARRGEATLHVSQVTLDRNDANSARLEGWTVTYVGEGNWEVCGSVSGLQNLDGAFVSCDEVDSFTGTRKFAQTNVLFESEIPKDAVEFTILADVDDLRTSPPDRFVFATTGFTVYSEPIEVRNGQVDPGPEAIIDVTSDELDCPNTCFPGVTVTYDGGASIDSDGEIDGIVAYRWDIGDDNTPGDPPDETTESILVTYEDPGSYAVRLTVVEAGTNRIGQATYTIEVRNRPPVALFTATPDTGPAPLVVTFDASGSSDPDGDVPLTYEWDFDYQDSFDSELGPTSNPEVTRSFDCASNEGCVVRVALRVHDTLGNFNAIPATLELNVGNRPPQAVLEAIPTVGTAPLTVKFDASDTTDPEGDALTYAWSFDDGTQITNANHAECQVDDCSVVLHTFQNTGMYTVNMVVTDTHLASDSKSVTIQVNLGSGNIITADMTATPLSGPSPLRVNFSAVASDTDGQALIYRWDFDDGTLGSGTNTSHTYTNTGDADEVYDPVLVVSDADGTQATVTRRITVQPGGEDEPSDNPDLEVSFTLFEEGMQQGTAPHTVLFDTRGTRATGGAELDRIEIVFGDNSTSVQQVPGMTSHQYQTLNGGTASYDAQATVYAKDGTFRRSSEITITVNASQPPMPSWAATPRSGVAPLVVNFDAGGTFDGEEAADQLRYSWEFGDGTLGSGMKTSHTYRSTGEYFVKLTVTDSTGVMASLTDQAAITVTSSSDDRGGGLPPVDGGGDGQEEPADDSGEMCGLQPMGAAQMLLMFLGLFGVRAVRRRF